jgi:hypothetical protein
VLALLGLLAGALVASPVGAAITKSKVKKIATKIATSIATNKANEVFDAKIGPATAGFQPDLMWAHIDADGTILSQSGGISVQDDDTDLGGYYLHFPAVVNGKGILATPDFRTRDGSAEIYVAPCGGGADGVNCGPGTDTTSDLYVETANSAGANTDTAFYVAVIP